LHSPGPNVPESPKQPPDPEIREEQLELLRSERDAAWAAANRLEAALGLPEPW